MKTLSLSETKMKLSALVDRVHKLDEQVTITKNGRAVAVLISADEMERYRETAAVQSDSELMAEIKQGLKDLQRRKTKARTVDGVFGP